MGSGGAPGIAGAPGVAGFGAAGTPVGAGGFVAAAGGTPGFAGAGTVAAAGGAFGAAGFAGYGGGFPLNGVDGGGSESSCGCRIAEHENASGKSVALFALAAGLGLGRRRGAARKKARR